MKILITSGYRGFGSTEISTLDYLLSQRVKAGLSSHYLVQEISHLQDRHDFKQIFVAAHSMGGLLARSFIKKYRQKYPGLSDSIRLLITVNSPLGGMSSALFGVEHSPIVLPVWRDLAPGSAFLVDLNNWPWPSDKPRPARNS